MIPLQEKHIKTMDTILRREISGTFFLRNELQEFMLNDEITALLKRADQLYEAGKLKNNGRSYNPKYRLHRMVDADTAHPKVAFQVLLPGNSLNKAEVAGELLLSVQLADHGGVTFTLPPESEAQKLARENNWKASEAELQALDNLISAARELQKLGNRNFPVKVEVGSSGVKVGAHYHDPMKAVRLALAG
jgi:hypothetical protein